MTEPLKERASESPMSTFPARLADIIGNSSVRAFARRAAVSDTFVRQCLAGRTEPTRTKLLAIAQAGGVSVEWLATGNGTRTYGVAEPAAIAPPAALDVQTLESVLELVETAIDQSDRELSPGQKARLIISVYDLHTSHDSGSLSLEHIREMVQAAA